uniref:Uncharacterized protein n=1 Tax=Anguilla anguilla TaxID=7936 RepID=A0A0E9TKC6_ANGAN
MCNFQSLHTVHTVYMHIVYKFY